MKKQKIEPLVAVDHATVTYEPFNKDFYDEHEELKALPDDRVKQLRYILFFRSCAKLILLEKIWILEFMVVMFQSL